MKKLLWLLALLPNVSLAAKPSASVSDVLIGSVTGKAIKKALKNLAQGLGGFPSAKQVI